MDVLRKVLGPAIVGKRLPSNSVSASAAAAAAGKEKKNNKESSILDGRTVCGRISSSSPPSPHLPIEIIPSEEMPMPLRVDWVGSPKPRLLKNEEMRKVILLAQRQVLVAFHGPDEIDRAGQREVVVLLSAVGACAFAFAFAFAFVFVLSSSSLTSSAAPTPR